MSSVKYLTDATLFAPAADKWAGDRHLLNDNGGLMVLRSAANLSDLPDTNSARINLGLRIGVDIQSYSAKLSLYAGGASPSSFTLSLVDKLNAETWREALGAGTVNSVAVSGGNTGLLFTGGPITNSGTLTLDGTLSVANGGTGVSSLGALKSALALNNVDNTSDASKPISTAVQTALNAKLTSPNGSTTQYIRGDGTLASFPNIPESGFGTVTSIQMFGGSTGLEFTGGPVTSSGTITIGGILNIASGGTGTTSLAQFKTDLNLNNVDNTADANKPISSATATALSGKFNNPGGTTTDYLRGDGTIAAFPISSDGKLTLSGAAAAIGVGASPLTNAWINIAAPTNAKASIIIQPGVVLTTPVSGAVESDGSHLYWTTGSGIRKQLDNDLSDVQGQFTAFAGEALAINDFVYIYFHSGTSQVRVGKALGSDVTRWAMGFVRSAYGIGEVVTITRIGWVPVTVANFQAEVFLSDSVAGGWSTTAPTDPGKVIQSLGIAIPGKGIHFSPNSRIEL